MNFWRNWFIFPRKCTGKCLQILVIYFGLCVKPSAYFPDMLWTVHLMNQTLTGLQNFIFSKLMYTFSQENHRKPQLAIRDAYGQGLCNYCAIIAENLTDETTEPRHTGNYKKWRDRWYDVWMSWVADDWYFAFINGSCKCIFIHQSTIVFLDL